MANKTKKKKTAKSQINTLKTTIAILKEEVVLGRQANEDIKELASGVIMSLTKRSAELERDTIEQELKSLSLSLSRMHIDYKLGDYPFVWFKTGAIEFKLHARAIIRMGTKSLIDYLIAAPGGGTIGPGKIDFQMDQSGLTEAVPYFIPISQRDIDSRAAAAIVLDATRLFNYKE